MEARRTTTTSRKRRRPVGNPGDDNEKEEMLRGGTALWWRRRAALGCWWVLAMTAVTPASAFSSGAARIPSVEVSVGPAPTGAMLVEAESAPRIKKSATRTKKKHNQQQRGKPETNRNERTPPRSDEDEEYRESNNTKQKESSVPVPGTLRRMAPSQASSSSRTLRSKQPPRRLLARTRVIGDKERQDARRNYSEEEEEKDAIASTYRSVEERFEWLEWELLQRGMGPNDFSDVRKGVYLAAAGDPSLMEGILGFLDVLLRLDHRSPSATNPRSSLSAWSLDDDHDDDQNDNDDDGMPQGTLLFDKDVLLASVLHYAECVAPQGGSLVVLPGTTPLPLLAPGELTALPALRGPSGAARPEGNTASTSLRERLEALYARREESPANTHEDGEDADFGSIFSFFGPGVLRLAGAASRIRRAEALSEALLSRTTADPETVQNLLVSVSGDDWRALAIRCAASLHRLEAVLDRGLHGGEPTTAATTLVRRRPLPGSDARHPRDVAAARSAIRVYAALSQRMGLQLLKTQLEARAFKILYPRQYRVAESLFDHRGDSMEAIAGYLRHRIFRLLKQDSSLLSQLEDLSVSCRVKEPYSYWKKLLKQHGKQQNSAGGPGLALARGGDQQPSEVQDGVALRVVLKARRLDPQETPEDTQARERFLCYYVHGLLRSIYPETHPGRVKDYIRHPKPNGYQSLHHTSAIRKDEHEFPFEIQVRSTRMHQIAEFGLAAHWDYKQQTTNGGRALPPVAAGDASPRLLPAAAEPQEELPAAAADARPNHDSSSQYLKTLETARQSLVRSTIFCFVAGSSLSELEHGQLLSLEAGARISDILADLQKAYADHQTIDKGSLAPWKNGQPADWDEELENGDVLLFDQHRNEPRTN